MISAIENNVFSGISAINYVLQYRQLRTLISQLRTSISAITYFDIGNYVL